MCLSEVLRPGGPEQSKAPCQWDEKRHRVDLLFAAPCWASDGLGQSMRNHMEKTRFSECSQISTVRALELKIHFSKALVLISDTENEVLSPRASACVLLPHAKFSRGFVWKYSSEHNLNMLIFLVGILAICNHLLAGVWFCHGFCFITLIILSLLSLSVHYWIHPYTASCLCSRWKICRSGLCLAEGILFLVWIL